jgi:acetyl-CoA carboxylase biotin carboxyl carrier protein
MATARKGAKAVEKSKSAGAAAGPTGSPGATHGDSIVDTVRGLAAVVAEHSLSELIVDLPDATITLRRGAAGMVGPMPMQPMPMQPMAMPMPMQSPPMAMQSGVPFTSHAHQPTIATPAPDPHDNAHVVTSPFVGTFYRRPNPDSPTYVDINERVDKGQVLCIVEAMKLMNEIEADIAGTVVGVLAEDGAPVEYGQPLFKIAPA